jgi:hypothetical protein
VFTIISRHRWHHKFAEKVRAMRQGSVDPVGTLSVGNVVTAAVTLLKSNFGDYFQLVLRSMGWLIVGFLASIPAIFVGALLSQASQGLGIFVGVLLWLGAFLFCLGKYMANRAMISRLAYQQLINRPETVRDVSQILGNSQWRFLGLGLWLVLFGIVAFILAYLVLLVGVGMGVFLSTQVSGPVGWILATVFSLAGFLGFLYILLRYGAAVFISELPVAIEGKVSSGLEGISRSWQLTAPYVGRVMLILFVAFLITLPLSMVANSPTALIYADLFSEMQKGMADPTAFSSAASSSKYAILNILSFVLSILLELFLVPFYQAIKSVLYFDLRSRREGNDLGMRS